MLCTRVKGIQNDDDRIFNIIRINRRKKMNTILVCCSIAIDTHTIIMAMPIFNKSGKNTSICGKIS